MTTQVNKSFIAPFITFFSDIGGGEGPTPEEKEKLEQLERERLDALREAEERRVEKHRKMEEEREGMRQGIRDKVYFCCCQYLEQLDNTGDILLTVWH